ncbi:IS66 family insertion sequence element accessory protein TnpB [Faecalibacillus faecis]|jgi:hypothetical protein|uniref:IS66 family insertion sequence element accessory protein TnpB n=1 Tax=Faecalibacillus faecis TaxID=1982628 RepID=UPI003FD8DD42
MIINTDEIKNIYVDKQFCDMRKQIDGLSAIVQQNFKLDSFSKDINLLPVEGVMSFFVYVLFLVSSLICLYQFKNGKEDIFIW